MGRDAVMPVNECSTGVLRSAKCAGVNVFRRIRCGALRGLLQVLECMQMATRSVRAAGREEQRTRSDGGKPR